MWSDAALVVAVVGAFVAAVTAALHAILYKRDVRASIGWAGFIFVRVRSVLRTGMRAVSASTSS